MIKHIKISDKVINELREIVQIEIMKSYSTKILDLSNIHDVLERDKINELRMKIFAKINPIDQKYIKLISVIFCTVLF